MGHDGHSAWWHDQKRLMHGSTPRPNFEALLTGDPDLALVHGDMAAYMEAHPCECEAMCECEDEA